MDVSGAEWRLKREGSGGRLLSLHGATHGGVKHGETARMIDGILRRCRHAMGVRVPHYLLASELAAHTDGRGVPALTPSGGARARVPGYEFPAASNGWRCEPTSLQHHLSANPRTLSVKNGPVFRTNGNHRERREVVRYTCFLGCCTWRVAIGL